MSGEMSRRELLSRRGLGEVFRKVTPMLGIKAESEQLSVPVESPEVKEPETIAAEERTVMDGYLSSPLYSYALLSEMPWDMLVEEARRRGIPYEGLFAFLKRKDLAENVFWWRVLRSAALVLVYEGGCAFRHKSSLQADELALADPKVSGSFLIG